MCAKIKRHTSNRVPKASFLPVVGTYLVCDGGADENDAVTLQVTHHVDVLGRTNQQISQPNIFNQGRLQARRRESDRPASRANDSRRTNLVI
jgi:hypothetical protein